MERNLTSLVDFYELTMMYAYFKSPFKDRTVIFDMFYRKNPDNGGYVIACGQEQLVDYITNIKFTEEDIKVLRSKDLFDEEFLEYLRNFKFNGTITGVKEGTIVYPNEPLFTIEANVMEAQLIETMLLLTINHQSLIATKANRIKRAAGEKIVMEFGARRAQGYDAAEYGARAAYIGGVDATATLSADVKFGVPAVGTIAHSYIQFYGDEYEAFKAYAETYPDNCSLLIDTYDVLKSGIPNVIKIEKEVLRPLGKHVKSVRIDSGDLAYLSKRCRQMLDEAGMEECKIVVSNSIDEHLINSLLNSQGAKIDSFGVGERLITSSSSPVMGGVYKLMAVKNDNGEYEPRIKISENIEKVTNPGFKKLWRLIDLDTQEILADYISLYDEDISNEKTLFLSHPSEPWKKHFINNFVAVELHETLIKNGEVVYKSDSLEDIRNYVNYQLKHTYPTELRFENPSIHMVSLSEKLFELKQKMLEEHYAK